MLSPELSLESALLLLHDRRANRPCRRRLDDTRLRAYSPAAWPSSLPAPGSPGALSLSRPPSSNRLLASLEPVKPAGPSTPSKVAKAQRRKPASGAYPAKLQDPPKSPLPKEVPERLAAMLRSASAPRPHGKRPKPAKPGPRAHPSPSLPTVKASKSVEFTEPPASKGSTDASRPPPLLEADSAEGPVSPPVKPGDVLEASELLETSDLFEPFEPSPSQTEPSQGPFASTSLEPSQEPTYSQETFEPSQEHALEPSQEISQNSHEIAFSEASEKDSKEYSQEFEASEADFREPSEADSFGEDSKSYSSQRLDDAAFEAMDSILSALTYPSNETLKKADAQDYSATVDNVVTPASNAHGALQHSHEPWQESSTEAAAAAALASRAESATMAEADPAAMNAVAAPQPVETEHHAAAAALASRAESATTAEADPAAMNAVAASPVPPTSHAEHEQPAETEDHAATP